MPKYEKSTDLKNLAETLIEKHHPNLKEVKIAYEFRDEASVSNGKVVAGRTVRVDDRNYALHGHDVIIEIAKDVWDEATDKFRIAIMDHELSHVGVRLEEYGEPQRDLKTDRVKVYLKHHDIEEFADVLERYGAYHADLRAFLAAFERNKKAEDPEGIEDDMSV